jgi:hypothetical protein
MEKMQEWLMTPQGMLAQRIVSTIIKAGLVWVSTKIPALGLGESTDRLVAELTPWATVSLIVWWTTRQQTHVEKRVKKALMTEPPKQSEGEKG